MSFTDIFIRRPVLATVVSLMILLIGLAALLNLPVRQFPKLTNTTITITTAYPGANAELIRGFITTPLLQAVASAEGIDTLTSSSKQNVSTITLNLRLDANADRAVSDVLSKVQQVKAALPRESQDPVVVRQTGDPVALMYMSFNSPVMKSSQITDYLTRVVQPRLQTIDGVANAQILGGQTFAMRVWLNPDKMAALGITPLDVRNALAANNFVTAAGQVKADFVQTTINAETSLNDPAAFAKLVVATRGDALIRLYDVATIELGPESADSSSVFDGLKAVFVGVFANPTANPLTVIAKVRQAFPDIERQLPAGMEAAIAYDATKFIEASIHEVQMTLFEAALIVIVVIFLFLGNLRSTLIPIVTIPLSLIGVMFALLALGYSLNLLTLLALVLAIGLVVDDAIVVVENIHRHIEEGMQPFDAAITGAREIAVPVISMTITLAAVYAPIGFVSGLTGMLFREFAFTLAGAVIVSGVIALTLSPMMASRLLKPHTGSGALQPPARPPVRQPAPPLRAAPAPHARPPPGNAAGAGRRDGGDRHHVHDHAARAGARGRPGHPVQHRQGAADGQPRLPGAGNGPARQAVRDSAGEGARLHHQRLAGRASGVRRHPVQAVERAQALAKADPAEPAGARVADRQRAGVHLPAAVAAGLHRRPAGAVRHHHHRGLHAAGAGAGEDPDRRAEERHVHLHRQRPEVRDAADRAQDRPRQGQPARHHHAGHRRVAGDLARRQLRQPLQPVRPQLPGDPAGAARLPPHRPIGSSAIRCAPAPASLVPLSSIVSVEQSVQPNALNTFQQLNSAVLTGVPFPGRTVGEALDLLKDKAAKHMPAGFTYDFQGESRQYVQEGNTLVITFVFALIIIYLVLAAQYESFRDPLIILIALPTAMFGALIPMNLGLASINIYTQVGLVTLIGLISKHGILMVDYANHLQENEGLSRPRGDRARGGDPAAAHPDDDGGDGGGHGAAADRQRSRCRQPLLDRAGDRRRHDDRHAVYAVRDAGGLQLRGPRPRGAPRSASAPPRGACGKPAAEN